MLSRMELEYIAQRANQLLDICQRSWHRIPPGNMQAAASLNIDIVDSTKAIVATRAELEKPSEIAPAPPYPGVAVPLPEYLTLGGKQQ